MELITELEKLDDASKMIYLQNIMMQNLAIIFLAGQGGSYVIPESEFNAVQNLIAEGIIFEFRNVNGDLKVSLKSTKLESSATNESNETNKSLN
jgi:hypothetical protein